MSFLAPAFLLGGLAIGLPILFHLIRRTTRERQPFSSLMFLASSPPRLTRRSRLEHLLLLVLRCTLIALLAVGFARPFLRKALSTPETAARRLLLLVDTSASMRRANLWSEASARAQTILGATSAADEVAIFTFDRRVNPVLTFEQWRTTTPAQRTAVASGKLSQLSPGWSDTHLGSALIEAAEILADNGGRPFRGTNQIVLISDLQQGSHVEAVQGYEWPRNVRVQIEDVTRGHRGNASLQLLAENEDAGGITDSGIRVRISNDADSKHDQFRVGWESADNRGFEAQPLPVYVPPGQSRVINIAGATASNRLHLAGDEDDFDNSIYVAPRETERLQVVYVGTDTNADPKQPLYFLQRALQQSRHRAITVLPRKPDEVLSTTELRDAGLTIVVAPLPAQARTVLREQVVEGKTVLFVLTSTSAADTLRDLLADTGIAVEEVHPPNYAMLGQIDFQHPILAPFADPRFSDFARIHFWRYRKVGLGTVAGTRVLAAFDSGDPALVEITVGKGRILVLTAGWQPAESQLALSSKFVPLLYSMLDAAGAPAPLPYQFQVGDRIPLSRLGIVGGSAWRIRQPDGVEVALSTDQTNYSGTLVPGIYTVQSQPAKQFAVNLNPTESLTMLLSLDDFERFGVPLERSGSVSKDQVAAREARLTNVELEGRQKTWRWVFLAILGTLLIESCVAGRAARRGQLQSSPRDPAEAALAAGANRSA